MFHSTPIRHSTQFDTNNRVPLTVPVLVNTGTPNYRSPYTWYTRHDTLMHPISRDPFFISVVQKICLALRTNCHPAAKCTRVIFFSLCSMTKLPPAPRRARRFSDLSSITSPRHQPSPHISCTQKTKNTNDHSPLLSSSTLHLQF